MTEDSIRVTPGRPTAGAGGHADAGHRRRGRVPVPTELIALVVGVLAILIAALVTDDFDATIAWGYVTLLLVAYILSRGLVKRGHGDDGL